MPAVAATIFLSAFLLFSVQLLVGKHILPWFGGASAVWTTCMLFFQVLLLAGYAYAHWLSGLKNLRTQKLVHLSLLALSVLSLILMAVVWGAPLLPDPSWRPDADSEPVLSILLVLSVAVGLPFLILSTTNPLLQSWRSAADPDRSPYRLYALSNLGSLLGLISYPLLIEVWLPLRQQAVAWTALFVLFALGVGLSAGLSIRRSSVSANTRAASPDPGPAPSRGRVLLWFSLAACGTLLMLATTNRMTQDIAAVPLLWMLPLAIYLISLILCFDGRNRYSRRWYAALLIPVLVFATLLLQHGAKADIVAQIALLSLTLFVTVMVCHGELANLKPHPRYLTIYYLSIAAGGALGGLLVAVVAPLVFPGYWELPLALWLTMVLLLVIASSPGVGGRMPFASKYLYAGLFAAVWTAIVVFGHQETEAATGGAGRSPATTWLMITTGLLLAVLLIPRDFLSRWTGVPAGPDDRHRRSRRLPRIPLRKISVATAMVFMATLLAVALNDTRDTIASTRNFYGIVSVLSTHTGNDENHHYRMRHGQIIHGLQFSTPARRMLPTGYYGPNSGVGLAIQHHPGRKRAAASSLRIGVVGLGTGTLASYGRSGDRIRFYEINPAVVRLAHGRNSLFRYLGETPATVEVVVGDARMAMERELRRGERQRYDVLVLDAFNSDAIPVHLLTREAFAIYLSHLSGNGILAVHISNRHLDLQPVVASVARHFGLHHRVVEHRPDTGYELSSVWVLLSRRDLASIPLHPRPDTPEAAAPPRLARLWTDDYTNLFRVIRKASPKRLLGAAETICLPPECEDDGISSLGL